MATTVALSFISFWRGAAIVLSDLASSMFYAGGIAEQAVGKSAAWYILAVMIFSFAVRAVYTESCGMFVRGGVYVVVRDSIGMSLSPLVSEQRHGRSSRAWEASAPTLSRAIRTKRPTARRTHRPLPAGTIARRSSSPPQPAAGITNLRPRGLRGGLRSQRRRLRCSKT